MFNHYGRDEWEHWEQLAAECNDCISIPIKAKPDVIDADLTKVGNIYMITEDYKSTKLPSTFKLNMTTAFIEAAGPILEHLMPSLQANIK